MRPRKVSEMLETAGVAVNWDGKVLAPCGACRELMTQLMPDGYRDIEIMLDYETKEIVKLGELTPRWWI